MTGIPILDSFARVQGWVNAHWLEIVGIALLGFIGAGYIIIGAAYVRHRIFNAQRSK